MRMMVMSAHFKWYPGSEEVVIPWNARYPFPSQSNKAEKMTPRIPPKSGSSFAPGQIIRVEFPAQGYVNPINTTLEFDVTLYGTGTAGQPVRFQNNIQSIFSRVRLLYGATPLEDIINYNHIVRALTEWTATNQNGTLDQTSVAEGIGGYVTDKSGGDDGFFGHCNTRQKFIHGVNSAFAAAAVPANFTGGGCFGNVGSTNTPAGVTGNGTQGYTRRYQVNLALGMFTQDKLIPTKFMASQLAIEITLEQAQGCIFAPSGISGTLGVNPLGTPPLTINPTYGVGNVNLIPEILQFDASYDAMFLQGLRTDGVPLKFASWHTFIFGSGQAQNVNLLVQERSRSVKALFCVQKRPTASFGFDSGAMFFDTSTTTGTLQNYQWRIGGRYFPGAPVQTSAIGQSTSNGAAEAFIELTKALNTVGDYRLSTNVNAKTWGVQPASTAAGTTALPAIASGGVLMEYDYMFSTQFYSPAAQLRWVEQPIGTVNFFSGTIGSSNFCMATNLEISNGVEISGLNAEEQSDIALIAQWFSPQVLGCVQPGPSNLEVYSFYDAMIVLRENNVIFNLFRFWNSFNKSKRIIIKYAFTIMSFGVSSDLKYYEFELDSYDATQAFQSGAAITDWPLFKVGGKRPLENIAAMKVIEVEIPFTWYVFNSSNNTFILNEV